MKNEDLYVYKKSDFYEDFISSQKEYYERTNADAYFAERLAEKDKEIAELKAKLMPCLNGDCILTCEVVEKYGKENAELKQKLEDVQASMYADVVDANMENRKLKEDRRWRKFSEEKPERHKWILVFYPNHSQFTTGVELRRWDDGCKYDVEVQEIYEKWMPLPEPPKEADK